MVGEIPAEYLQRMAARQTATDMRIPTQTALAGCIGTLFLLQWWHIAHYPTWLWAALLVPATIALLLRLHVHTGTWITPVFAGLLGIAVAFPIAARTAHISTQRDLEWYAGEEGVFIGRIAAEPDRRPMDTRYTVDVWEVHTASGTVLRPIRGRMLAIDRETWPILRYGERVRITGLLERPEPIEQFAYDRYLERYGIRSIIWRARIEKLPGSATGYLLRSLYRGKETFEKGINRLYAEPHASFMAGLLTGSRKGIPPRNAEDFQRTGLTHIIAISGTNVAILLVILSTMLVWMPIRWRLVPSIIGICVFVLFVGASASVVRAGIMGALGLFASQAGRIADARTSLLWTTAIMSAWNPAMLWYDAGFQLSVGAVIGLVEIAPVIEPCFRRIPALLGIREAVQMTCAAEIATLPLIFVFFGALPIVAPLANLLAAPAIPPAMLLGFLSVVAGWLWLPLGQVFAVGAWAFLEWILWVAHMFARVPFGLVSVSTNGVWFAPVYYATLFIGLWIVRSGRIHQWYTRNRRVAPIQGTSSSCTGIRSRKAKV